MSAKDHETSVLEASSLWISGKLDKFDRFRQVVTGAMIFFVEYDKIAGVSEMEWIWKQPTRDGRTSLVLCDHFVRFQHCVWWPKTRQHY